MHLFISVRRFSALGKKKKKKMNEIELQRIRQIDETFFA